jgi:hypothetical protein
MDFSAGLTLDVAGPTTMTSTSLPGAKGKPVISARRPALIFTFFLTARKILAFRIEFHLSLFWSLLEVIVSGNTRFVR